MVTAIPAEPRLSATRVSKVPSRYRWRVASLPDERRGWPRGGPREPAHGEAIWARGAPGGPRGTRETGGSPLEGPVYRGKEMGWTGPLASLGAPWACVLGSERPAVRPLPGGCESGRARARAVATRGVAALVFRGSPAPASLWPQEIFSFEFGRMSTCRPVTAVHATEVLGCRLERPRRVCGLSQPPLAFVDRPR